MSSRIASLQVEEVRSREVWLEEVRNWEVWLEVGDG